MYYPVQIPFVLSKEFSQSVKYTEELLPQYNDFIICFWEMQSLTQEPKEISNIITTDGCIDLVVEYENKLIGFAGFSKTNFDYKMNLPTHSFGARFKAGAFNTITNLHAQKAMNNLLPLTTIDKDFDTDFFFSLPFDKAKDYFKEYIGKLVKGKLTNDYLKLFDRYFVSIPNTTAEIYKNFHYSPKQCQRIFAKIFGLTPQMVLSILRFQKCLTILTSTKSKPSDVLSLVSYYDQAHFIKDFKRNIGLTPFELVAKYK